MMQESFTQEEVQAVERSETALLQDAVNQYMNARILQLSLELQREKARVTELEAQVASLKTEAPDAASSD